MPNTLQKQDKQPLTEKIIVNTTADMKLKLQKLAAKNQREFSDFIRIEWKKLIK